ncbi:amidohydrolase family protein [Gordonia hydrophobica]|uniref:Amidohydrolase family protein n=1 Tax=Gordonia hydrophobica TaxID=40516 RepID=A0ABZ2U1X7_9ACTN|nr:amidohydrolase family protein [Gordonia hydrophobica]MBM7369244.1 putative TIM-barrel fold metal-dependent hydrolase [Gordonia hydrophobica]
MTDEQFKDAPIFDADQHMYETPEALTKYLPEKYKSAVNFLKVGHQTRISILGKIRDYIPNPTFDKVAAPGAWEAFFAAENHEGKTLSQMARERVMEATPSFRAPEPRIVELDKQGVSEALVYPTLANLVEHSASEDPELCSAMIHALNQWMLETWGFTHENRLFMTPVINLGLLDEALKELEYVLNNGAKVILIKPAPVRSWKGWRSPALPEFDPFWKEVEAAGLPVVLHASQPPLDDYINQWEPPNSDVFTEMSAFRWIALGHREITDMITSLITHGTFTRFPKLRVASIENGSAWLDPLFHDFDDFYKKMPQAFPEHPIDVFKRNIWVSPFWEGSVEDVVNTVGWDRVMFGSDFPHPEGLVEPKGYWRYAEGMDEKRTYDFMGDNARRFLGLPVRNPAELATV